MAQSNADDNILDLQALAPTSVKLKLPNGETVEVKPPKTEQVLRIGFLGQQMGEIRKLGEDNPNELTDEMREKLQTVMDGLEEQIKIVIPDLAEYNLNMLMITKLADFIGEMGAPGQADALAAQGGGEATDPKAPKTPKSPTPESPTS